VTVRERHYQQPKYANEYELYLLKKFYVTFDKQYVATCERHIQKLKRQYKKKFSWDNIWNRIEKRYGFGRDTFCTCTDLYVQSMKDQREMEQMFNVLPTTTSNRDDDSSSRNVENEINELIRNLSVAAQADHMTKASQQLPIIKHGKTHAELVEHYTSCKSIGRVFFAIEFIASQNAFSVYILLSLYAHHFIQTKSHEYINTTTRLSPMAKTIRGSKEIPRIYIHT